MKIPAATPCRSLSHLPLRIFKPGQIAPHVDHPLTNTSSACIGWPQDHLTLMARAHARTHVRHCHAMPRGRGACPPNGNAHGQHDMQHRNNVRLPPLLRSSSSRTRHGDRTAPSLVARATRPPRFCGRGGRAMTQCRVLRYCRALSLSLAHLSLDPFGGRSGARKGGGGGGR